MIKRMTLSYRTINILVPTENNINVLHTYCNGTRRHSPAGLNKIVGKAIWQHSSHNSMKDH
jgi:hypothetical protein